MEEMRENKEPIAPAADLYSWPFKDLTGNNKQIRSAFNLIRIHVSLAYVTYHDMDTQQFEAQRHAQSNSQNDPLTKSYFAIPLSNRALRRVSVSAREVLISKRSQVRCMGKRRSKPKR